MSSYVVDPKTINKIVEGLRWETWTGHYPETEMLKKANAMFNDQLQEFGESLYSLNIDATMQRYGDPTSETLPGSIGEDGKLATYVYKAELRPTKIQLIKSLQCFLYQCSEGNVPETRLFKALEIVVNRLKDEYISGLDEYKAAEWA